MPFGERGGLRSFNLLPWRARQRKLRKRQALISLASGATAALVLLAGVELPLRDRLQSEAERIGQLRKSISLARREAADRDALQARKTQASLLLDEIERIRQSNRTAHDWLAALPARIPAGIGLTDLALHQEGWRLRGLAAELNQPAMLLARVREMPMVAEVRMDRLQSSPDGPPQFLLTGRFRK